MTDPGRPQLLFAYDNGRVTPLLRDPHRTIAFCTLPRRYPSLAAAAAHVEARFPQAHLVPLAHVDQEVPA